MQDKHWDLNPRRKITVGTWTQGRLGVKGEELSEEGTLSKAQVMVYGPEFTEGDQVWSNIGLKLQYLYKYDKVES